MVIELKEAAGISDETTREELETLAAVTWGDLAYEQDRNRHLSDLVSEMFEEHRRIYHSGGVLRMGPSATSKQMAHWYSECMRWGVEVD